MWRNLSWVETQASGPPSLRASLPPSASASSSTKWAQFPPASQTHRAPGNTQGEAVFNVIIPFSKVPLGRGISQMWMGESIKDLKARDGVVSRCL